MLLFCSGGLCRSSAACRIIGCLARYDGRRYARGKSLPLRSPFISNSTSLARLLLGKSLAAFGPFDFTVPPAPVAVPTSESLLMLPIYIEARELLSCRVVGLTKKTIDKGCCRITLATPRSDE